MDAVETAAAKLVRAHAARGGWDPAPCSASSASGRLCRSLSRRLCHPDRQRDPRPAGRPRRVRAPGRRRGQGPHPAEPGGGGRCARGPCGVAAIAEHAATHALEHPVGWRSHRALTRLAAVASDLEDLLSGEPRESTA